MYRKTWVAVFLIVTAWTLIRGGTPAHALDDDPLSVSRGLDVIVLVDVSGSMNLISVQQKIVPGSDPEQLRWDAVKLVVDLLGREDRLLVRRFNHDCPPRLETTGPHKQSQEFVDHLNTVLKYGSHSDDELFLPLETTGQRAHFVDKVKFFGGTGKGSGQGFFDFGGTGIVNALRKVAPRVDRAGDGRQKVVILLTDGLDDRFGDVAASKLLERWEAEEQKLRGELPAYAPSTGTGSDVTTYTFGLNLEATKSVTGEERVVLSRRLLSTLAAMNGGDFQDIQDSGGLVRGFQNLVWSLKECWRRDIAVESGKAWSEPTIVRPDIVDVSVLAWELDPKLAVPKNTKPPTGGIQHSWPAEVSVLLPAKSRGKDDSVYEYLHWEGVKKSGGAGDASALYASPFAALKGPVDLMVGLQESANPRQIAISKRTGVRLFQVLRPRIAEQFNRFQSLQLQVAMTAMVDFHPEQFHVTAQLFSEGGGQTKALKEIQLRHDGRRHFVGQLPLREIQYNPRDPSTYYSLGFLVQGLEVDQNPLGGFRLELPRRTIRVDNHLQLKPLPAVVLNRETPEAIVRIETAEPIDEELTLPVQFFPPSLNTEPVEAKHFHFEPGADFQQGRVVLKGGRATFKLALNKEDMPRAGVTYRPGKLRIPAVPDFRLEQRDSSVGLSIGLARVAIIPEMLELTVDPQVVRSPPFTVALNPKGQNAAGLGPLKVTLLPRKVEGEAEPESKFNPQELWLEGQDKQLEPDERKQSAEFELDTPFRVAVRPSGGKPVGTYYFDLKVEGDRIDPVTATVRILVEPPSLELRVKEWTAHATPGSTHDVLIEGRLKSNQPDDRDQLHVEGGGRAAKFAFVTVGEASRTVEIPLDSPGKLNPFEIAGTVGEEWTTIPLTLKIPTQDVVPYGRYDCILKLGGEKVPMQEFALHVVVNDLRVEWPFEVKGQPEPAWRPVSSRRLIQFLEDDDGMKKKIRIRTELNDAIDPGDVQVRFLAPFVDGIGDPQKLPRIVGKHVLPAPRHGVEVELGFDKVINFNQPGRGQRAENQKGQYTVMLQVNTPSLQIPGRTTKFTVQYLKQDDLVP